MAGPVALERNQVLFWIHEALHICSIEEQQAELDARHQAARSTVIKAAQSLQAALISVNPLSGKDASQLAHHLEMLVSSTPWTVQKLPTGKGGRPRLSRTIQGLHHAAKGMLQKAGIPPHSGSGASIARLGALLCAAAGINLPKGESTEAARNAITPWICEETEVTPRPSSPWILRKP
jgi:hypothetical protein